MIIVYIIGVISVIALLFSILLSGKSRKKIEPSRSAFHGKGSVKGNSDEMSCR